MDPLVPGPFGGWRGIGGTVRSLMGLMAAGPTGEPHPVALLTDLGDTSYVSRIRGHQLGTARRYSSYSRPKRRRNAGSSYQWTNDHTVAPNTTA